MVGSTSMTGPSRETPSNGDTVHVLPSNSVKVWPRQNAGSGARTRITISSPSVPRTLVSSASVNPG